MSFHFFTIPTLDPEAAEGALNQFCVEHRVVSAERQFVAARGPAGSACRPKAPRVADFFGVRG